MIQHTYTGVLGLAINQDREFLITQRNQPETPEIHQHWQVPGGGIEFGEQPEETLFREMKEELDIVPEILFPYPICKTQVWQRDDQGISIYLMTYLITIGQQIPTIIDPESLDYKWVKQNQLYRLKSLPLTQVFIDEATKICNEYGLWPHSPMIK